MVERRKLKPGELLSRFRIIKALGAGGMGDVYFALDTERFINVALKVLHRDHPQFEKLKKRFILEAEVYRKISHPNVVGMVDEGHFSDVDFIALEHIRGRSLLQILSEQGVIPLEEAQSYMVDLIYAINAAHQRDVIHRDIKPHNIMVTQEGVIKLIDFGVAKETEILLVQDSDRSVHFDEAGDRNLGASGNTLGFSSSGSSTGVGNVVGTLAYSSPEQLQCQVIDGRSDIYSLGLVLYEIFTGMRPIAGNSASDILLCQSKLDEKIVLPSKIQPGINREIEKMILKMIRYNPEERYQSSIELIETIYSLGLDKVTDEANSEQQRSKNLASLELADTYYWKALGKIDQGSFIEGLREFDKLFHSAPSIPSGLRKTISSQVDILFWTKHPIVPSLEGELPKRYLGDRLEFLDYVDLLGEVISIYRHLERQPSAILALVCLERVLHWCEEERPDVYEKCQEKMERIRSRVEFHWAKDSLESLREGGAAEDLALSRAIESLEENGHSTSSRELSELLLQRALLLCALHENEKAESCVKKLLLQEGESREGMGLALFLLAQREIILPSYIDYSSISLEVFLIMGLFSSAAKQIEKELHGDVSDLSVYQKIINLYRRAGLEEKLSLVYFEMAQLLVDQDCPDRVRRLLQKSLELSPKDEALILKIKSLKNIHKIFSIQELSSLGERPITS